MAGLDDSFTPPPRFADAVDQLHDIVTAQVGSADFGPSDYLPGLNVLTQSMDYDPHFSERGRAIAWGRLITALSGRANAYKAMRENPGYADVDITRPIVITGVPRTGTTALHKLMAIDPQFQGLQSWLVGAPQPRPPRASWDNNPQFQRTVDLLRQRYEAAPDSRAAHLMVAEEVDECCLLLWHSFVSNLWTIGWSAATYDAWWQSQSERPAYLHYRQCLQLIGSNEPEPRWLLKNPGHIANLDHLFAVFPDALVIQTHRDPANAIPSLSALLMHMHPVMEVGRDQQRARNMIARETAKWANAVHDADAVRQLHPGQILDVVHSEFHAEPLTVLKRIYTFAGLEMTPGVEAEMVQRIADKPELAHGAHRYDLADFGMIAEDIRERFGDYIDRYDLAPRTSTAAAA